MTPNCASAPGKVAASVVRSGDSGADHCRSRRAARGRGHDGLRRGHDHADLFRLPAMNVITLEIELALEREGFRHSKCAPRCRPPWTTDWMSEDGRRKLARIRHRAAASRKLPPGAVWRGARSLPAMRVQKTPKCFPSSARRPARRCGVARTAASRSIISSVIETIVIATRWLLAMTVRLRSEKSRCPTHHVFTAWP